MNHGINSLPNGPNDNQFQMGNDITHCVSNSTDTKQPGDRDIRAMAIFESKPKFHHVVLAGRDANFHKNGDMQSTRNLIPTVRSGLACEKGNCGGEVHCGLSEVNISKTNQTCDPQEHLTLGLGSATYTPLLYTPSCYIHAPAQTEPHISSPKESNLQVYSRKRMKQKKCIKGLPNYDQIPLRRRIGIVDFLDFLTEKNSVIYYEKKLEDIEENVRLKQSEASLAGEEARAAFVFFKSRFGAASAFHLQQSVNPTHWITELAPEPRDVYWSFFSESFTRRWISKLVVVLVCTTFTVAFLIPVVIVQGLTNLNQLEILFPFLTSITIKFVSQIVTGYLPSLILQLFLKLVPPATEFLSSIQGYISHSDIEMSASRKVLWFTVWHVFFATVLLGSILSMLNAVLDPKNIPGKLAVAVPAQVRKCSSPL
ncbi:hypothetical protein JHK87_000520 [Glycine soja]|nr:hypothetical protein JHK87_000520 [Glycine soja]